MRVLAAVEREILCGMRLQSKRDNARAGDLQEAANDVCQESQIHNARTQDIALSAHAFGCHAAGNLLRPVVAVVAFPKDKRERLVGKKDHSICKTD